MYLNRTIIVRIREAEYIQAKKITDSDPEIQNFSHFVRAAMLHFIRYKAIEKKLTLTHYITAELEHGQPGFNKSKIERPWQQKTDQTKMRRIKHGRSKTG